MEARRPLKGVPIRRNSPELLAALAVIAMSVALFLAPMTQSRSWPPSPEPAPLIVWILSVLSMGLALAASRATVNRSTRLVSALVIVVAGSCNALAVVGWSLGQVGNPLPGLVFLGLLLAVGGWVCRQRFISICALVLAVVTVGAAFLPGQDEITLDRLGIRAVLSSRGHSEGATVEDLGLVLSSTDDVPLRHKIGLEMVDTSARVGQFLPVPCWPFNGSSAWMDETPQDRSRIEMATRLFALGWAASVNVHLTVQRWPQRPLLAIRIPLKALPASPIRKTDGKASVETSQVRWSKSTNTLPVMTCLAITLSYSIPGRSGYRLSEIRIVDDRGNDIDENAGSVQGTDNGETEDLQLVGIANDAKWVEVQVFSPRQLAANQVTFDFDRIAVR